MLQRATQFTMNWTDKRNGTVAYCVHTRRKKALRRQETCLLLAYFKRQI